MPNEQMKLVSNSSLLAEVEPSGQKRNRGESRIQARNREKILSAATDIFSLYGFRGATLDQIAERAQMSKPNLLYYFSSKEELYLAVLRNILEIWLQPLKELDEKQSPEHELGAYIDQKIEFSRLYPMASRVFANEIAAGAPTLKPVLDTYLRDVVKKKARVIRKWIKRGEMADVDPYHLIMMIWAVTQHYADFAVQVDSLLGKSLDEQRFYNQTRKNIKQIIMRGVLENQGLKTETYSHVPSPLEEEGQDEGNDKRGLNNP